MLQDTMEVLLKIEERVIEWPFQNACAYAFTVCRNLWFQMRVERSKAIEVMKDLAEESVLSPDHEEFDDHDQALLLRKCQQALNCEERKLLESIKLEHRIKKAASFQGLHPETYMYRKKKLLTKLRRAYEHGHKPLKIR